MPEDRLTTDRAIRLLRAKNAELENVFKGRMETGDRFDQRDTWLIADVALIAALVANFMEDADASLRLYMAHSENLIERVHVLEESLDKVIKLLR